MSFSSKAIPVGLNRGQQAVAAGRGRGGACAPGGTVQGAAFEGAKIWNYEIWPLLAHWRLHSRQ